MILHENLKRLSKRYPDLAKRITDLKEERVSLIKARYGGWGARIITPFRRDGLFLNSMYDPIGEAKRLIKGVPINGEKIWLFLGLGLGYHLFELIHRIKGRIIIVERSIDIFKASLKIFDWGDILERVEVIVGERSGVAIQRMRMVFEESHGLDLFIIRHPASMVLFPHYYSMIEGEDFILKAQPNIAQNLRMVRHRGKRRRLKVLSFKIPRTIIRHILDDSIKAIMALGHDVRVIEPTRFWHSNRHFIERLSWEIRDFRPDLIFSVDHVGLVPRLFELMRVPYGCWWVDNPFFWVTKEMLIQGVSDYACIFLWDRGYTDNLKALGFKEIHFLPLATNPERFKKIELSSRDKERFSCEVSFVGSSTIDIALNFEEFFLKRIKDPSTKGFIKEAMRQQAINPLDWMEGILKRLGLDPSSLEDGERFSRILEFASMAGYREGILKALSTFDLRVYGDSGWRRIIGEGVYFGPADYENDLPKVYNGSKINLNITMAQMKEAINQRVYDVSACGGFVLSDFRPDLERLFELGKEVVCYQNIKELKALCDHFLSHPREREEMADRAQKRVLREHTYMVRMDEALRIMREVFL